MSYYWIFVRWSDAVHFAVMYRAMIGRRCRVTAVGRGQAWRVDA
jgi:hypothetical protein